MELEYKSGRVYGHPYESDRSVAQPGLVRWRLIQAVALVVAGMILCATFNAVVMHPYAVTHRGSCVFEIQPTGWNGEEVQPCGTLLTRFAISEEVYFAER